MQTHSGSIARLTMVVAAALACLWPHASHADSATDIKAGHAVFMQKGCYECHGTFGQGSLSTGPALAPQPIPAAAIKAYVRAPKGQMPVFSEKILSDDDITKIHAYLASIPPGRPASRIALLNATTALANAPSATLPTHGASLYAAHCASCHGEGGEGNIGPALVGISSRYTTATIEERIRNPAGIMPRLYPKPLSNADVKDVAMYLETLK